MLYDILFGYGEEEIEKELGFWLLLNCFDSVKKITLWHLDHK